MGLLPMGATGCARASAGSLCLVRHDRNRYKIDANEQSRLIDTTVGIVGLSVGNAVARTISLEGSCGSLRLADFDTLDLSNMNRLQAGVHELGPQ